MIIFENDEVASYQLHPKTECLFLSSIILSLLISGLRNIVVEAHDHSMEGLDGSPGCEEAKFNFNICCKADKIDAMLYHQGQTFEKEQ